LLGVMVMVAAYVVLKYGGLKIRKKVLIPVAAGLLLVAVPATLVMANRSEEDLEMSSAGRMTYLKAGLRMGVKHPLLGVGFNGYPSNLHLYNTESLEEDQQMTAHNSWVLVFAETGLFGLILFTAAFWFCLKMAWSLYREKPELLLALVGYGVTMVFLSHSYLIYPYLLYALILCAYRLRKEDPAWAC
jgi:O-antigen ligase